MASARRSGVAVESRDDAGSPRRAPSWPDPYPRRGRKTGEPAGARLAAVLDGARPPGVYRWLSRAHTAAVGRELRAAGWSAYPLDGRAIADGFALMDRLAGALAFPTWYRRHWEAVAACLADLSWLPAHGQVLLWSGYGVLAQADPPAWREAYRTFAEAARQRQSAGVPPVFLLLRGSGPTASPLDGHPIPLL